MKLKIWLTALLSLMIAMTSTARSAVPEDARMVVELVANEEEKGQSLNELHANVGQAADLALSRLWQRIIPQQALASVPASARAVRFMQRAQPTTEGIRITFNARRVLDYLETNKIPYIPEQPVWNLDLRMRNASGQNMAQSANLVMEFIKGQATDQGFSLSPAGDSLIAQWHWLDGHQVSLSVRGTSRLGEFQETRAMAPGDPLPQLQQWLLGILLKGRDAYANDSNPEPVTTVSVPAVDIYGQPLAGSDIYGDPYANPNAVLAMPVIQDDSILISVQRAASLPEQVLFEDDLRRDPRVASLLPLQLSQGWQQYRLKLKRPKDDMWLKQWFARHALDLTRTPDGWLAR